METNLSLPSRSARTAVTGRSVLVLAAATLLVSLGSYWSSDDHAATTAARNVAEHHESSHVPAQKTQLARAEEVPGLRFRQIM